MYKDELEQIKQSLATAAKAERSCAQKDKAAWAEERANLERRLVQMKTKIDRSQREQRDRETLSAAKKEEREKRKSGKGAWHMKKGEFTLLGQLLLTSRRPTRLAAQVSVRSSRSVWREDGGEKGFGQEAEEGRVQGEEESTSSVASISPRCPRATARSSRDILISSAELFPSILERSLLWMTSVDISAESPFICHVSSYISTKREAILPGLSTALAGTALHALLGHLGDVGASGRLGGLLVGLLLSLVRLGLGDGGLSSGSSDLGFGGSLGEDGSKVGTNDSSLLGQRCPLVRFRFSNPPGP